jgi:hypothetical protein
MTPEVIIEGVISLEGLCLKLHFIGITFTETAVP